MKYGIISDIHGNLEALEAVLPVLNGCDRWICLGDIVGYGPNPNACCERVRALGAACVIGNHDLAALGHYDLEWFNPWAAAAILWTQQQLSDEAREFLRSLPEVQVISDAPPTPSAAPDTRLDFTIVHGSLREPAEEYITSTWDALPTFELLNTPLCLIGHTHVAEYYVKPDSQPYCEQFSLLTGGALRLQEGAQYIVNCGSVGQPRDGNPFASCGLLNTGTAMLEVYRVEYNFRATQQKMQEAGLPDILWQRLAVGR